MMLRACLYLGIVVFLACQGGEQAQEIAASGEQLRKIPIDNPEQADSLREQGFDVIVAEDNYVVVRLHKEDSAKVQALDLNAEPIKESDLVQRLVKIPIREKSDASELAGLGMDIWEVRQDTVVAQVFDSQIFAARKNGYDVIIVAQNVRDTVKKGGK